MAENGYPTIRVGLLADTEAAASSVRSLLDPRCFKVVSSRKIDADRRPFDSLDTDFWLVCVEDFDESVESLIAELDDCSLPFLVECFDDFNFVSAGVETVRKKDQSRRLANKIRKRVVSSKVTPCDKPKAKFLWVLGASTGGPEAVGEFLREIPLGIRGVAFMYVQHIDQRMLPSLVKGLQRACSLPIELCDADKTLREGVVYIAMPDQSFEMNDEFELVFTNNAWRGDFKPSLSQVVAMSANKLRLNAGAIVFSGMGNDGADTVSMLGKAGGPIWVQSPESCKVDSMPVSVLARQKANLVASPKALAKKTIDHARHY